MRRFSCPKQPRAVLRICESFRSLGCSRSSRILLDPTRLFRLFREHDWNTTDLLAANLKVNFARADVKQRQRGTSAAIVERASTRVVSVEILVDGQSQA